ncbi:hypothetical protein SAMN04515691_4004 [Leifsonia sp. 98AMF]|nr:hypothetical protein SAMN04515690_0013 [Leifsonia sp. 197AMF]SDJ45773.1 hypothetical protein SAMN04515684_3770 [Leifsonia sp. 466MF]SDK29694.1 hypothetical protein SAMN04515683_2995 [Leifsonia sp. 157MF]SDN66131.1 hypothetical protein SAMN04515686_1957 [Leifsonia sp. 509MF]SEN42407.1 hypothetical protein SAMN04515685_2978 [Leifsonia sp. 467MF]SFM92253.1 hypothetical protein SAMN04515691_4004 [Leifsonia sp. 98AMF]
MAKFFDPSEAERILRAAGGVPLVPFPGVAKPWSSIHEACGRHVTPNLNTVRRSGSCCAHCAAIARGAARRARLENSAISTMRAAGFEPLAPYPGADKPWRSMHLECGEERSPSLNSVRGSRTGKGGCQPCSLRALGYRVWTEESARALMESKGLEPLVPYPGSSTVPWAARHRVCGRTVSPRLGNLAEGQGACVHCGQEATHRAFRKDHDVAAQLMRAAGLEPIEAFPGVDTPWKCRHLACGRIVSPTWTNIKRGQGGCSPCAWEKASQRLIMPEPQARAIMAAHDLTPLEPYPGSAKPWRSRHRCGREVSPTLSNVRAGKGVCRYCISSFPFAGPAILYLVADVRAVKVGIAARSAKRLDEHRRYGWEEMWRIQVPTGDDAYSLEQSILAWWRGELLLDVVYTKAEMPQWGASETAPRARMGSDAVLIRALQLLEETGVTDFEVIVSRGDDAAPDSEATSVGPRARRKPSASDQVALFDLD